MEQGSSILAGIELGSFSFAQEMMDAEFGDQRLTDQLIRTMNEFYKHPSLPVTGACRSLAQIKASYRLIGNERVTSEQIFSSHREQTIERMSKCARVLVPHDTTTMNYSSHLALEGMGQIGVGHNGRGLFLHTLEAFSEQGLPLGILGQIQWSRDELGADEERIHHPLSGSELERWNLSLENVAEAQKELPATEVIVLSDRESDFNDYLYKAKKLGLKIVLRAKAKTRKSSEQVALTQVLQNTPAAGEIEIEVRQFKGPKRWDGKEKVVQKKHKERHRRQARLKVYAAKVELRKPDGGDARYSSSEERSYWAVFVDEIDPPKDFEKVQWLLLTTEDVSERAKAFTVIDWYRQRWGIETFHKILKSGCRVESARFETAGRIKTFIAMMSIIAWKLHALVYAQREIPEAPCTQLLSEAEWRVLARATQGKNPDKPPSLREATRWIARLGGFMGRKGDGEPGPLTLWRGWQRLMDLVEGYNLYAANAAPQRYGE